MTSTAVLDSIPTHTESIYRSAFSTWDRKASVRSFPSSNDDNLKQYSGYWMPLTDDSILNHPMVSDEIKQKLSAYLLIGNLDFTYSLEQCLIAQVSANLAAGKLLSQLPQAVKIDALRVQCDEAYHAIQAYNLTEGVRHAADIKAPMKLDSHFLRFVDHSTDGRIPLPEDLIRFCAVAVSEILITKSLRDDWRDISLPKEIRSFFREHHKDEARHMAYYTWLLEQLWQVWPSPTREIMATLWPQFVDAYLDSEIYIARDALQHFEFS
ncbi:MAG: p-aminobenzoate N-oxygenase AurF family protein, partial [uncultured Thiotrichaceae bacterium]